MTIHWPKKLAHLLQAWAFSLVVATVQQGFLPADPYGANVVFSLVIGTTIWVVVDLGRHLMPSAAETGWPAGWRGVLLVVAGILTGFIVGHWLGELAARALGLLPHGPNPRRGEDLRIAGLITLLAGTVASYWFYARNKSGYLLRKMREATQHATEARLKLLETQLEPHMLFNTLANLRALIAVDPQRAQQMLDHMIDYLRATLDGSRATTHALQSEFDRLRDYLELMAIRMGPRLAFTLELPGDLQDVAVPTLLLQPLVENSIQHGLEPKVRGGRIDVRAQRQGDRLLLEVSDTGVGHAGATPAGPGFGLQQVRDRLQALYGEAASLEFHCNTEGAQARVALPIA
jgi:signal transduction histidine kinase